MVVVGGVVVVRLLKLRYLEAQSVRLDGPHSELRGQGRCRRHVRGGQRARHTEEKWNGPRVKREQHRLELRCVVNSTSTRPSSLSTMKVKVSWNKQLFDVEVDMEQPPLVFKTQLFTLTGDSQ